MAGIEEAEDIAGTGKVLIGCRYMTMTIESGTYANTPFETVAIRAGESRVSI